MKRVIAQVVAYSAAVFALTIAIDEALCHPAQVVALCLLVVAAATVVAATVFVLLYLRLKGVNLLWLEKMIGALAEEQKAKSWMKPWM